jgi:hypothetical protein
MKTTVSITLRLRTGCLASATVLAILASAAVPGEPGPILIEAGGAEPNQEAKLVPAPACTDDVLRRVRARTPEPAGVEIDCSLTLRREDVITKRLFLTGREATGVRIDCNGATLNGAGILKDTEDLLEIRSRPTSDPDVWERPTNVRVRDCHIVGSVRIYGMAKNGESGLPPSHPWRWALRDSSRRAGHTERARNNAPANIVLDNLTITAFHRTPVYFAPGVTHSSLLNSELRGEAGSVAVYLDAESTANTIENNHIHVRTSGREQVAVDGSSHNWIVNNWFSALNHGGIYLYRNCGEGGTIRHETPRRNTVVNNVFYYDTYAGPNPSVYLGSRNGGKTYCDDDEDDGIRLYGSSVSDADYARHNVVMQNQIYRRSPSEMIRTGEWAITPFLKLAVNTPNYIGHNETVASARSRPAGCYVGSGHETDFVLHGETLDIQGTTYTCDDGGLERVRPEG